MTPEEYRDYESWRENLLLNGPDVALEAYLHHIAAEAALAKEITE